MFLCGTFSTAVDSKKRVRLPAKLKAELGDKYILMPGIDGTIYVIREDQPQVILSTLTANESLDPEIERMHRELLSQCSCVDADVQGRFTLPANLVQYAGITGDIVIVGNITKAEIWSKECWDKRKPAPNSQSVTQLYSAISALGKK